MCDFQALFLTINYYFKMLNRHLRWVYSHDASILFKIQYFLIVMIHFGTDGLFGALRIYRGKQNASKSPSPFKS